MFRNSLPLACLLLLGAATCVFADEQLNLQDLTDRLQGNLADKIDISSLPKHEEVKNIFRDKCIRNSGSDEAFEKAMAARQDMKNCVTSLININELKQEMEIAKPTGDLDMVFKKYCAKSPDLKQCIFTFTATIEPCLDEQERANKVIIQNVADSLADFICYREGDRIALFIAEGGPECLDSKQEDIKNCINSTMGKYIPSAPITLENLPRLLLDSEQCQDLQGLQNCVVAELEKCEEPTPANIIESLFKFIRKQTPCAPKTK